MIQRIRAAVSHPSVAKSSSVGLGSPSTKLVIPSSSHAANLYVFPRWIFSMEDKTKSVDNLWMAYFLILQIIRHINQFRHWEMSFCWISAHLFHIPYCRQFQHTHPLLLSQTQVKCRTGNQRTCASTPKISRIKLDEGYKYIRRIHHFQQTSKFVLLISFEDDGMFSVLTFGVRARSWR